MIPTLAFLARGLVAALSALALGGAPVHADTIREEHLTREELIAKYADANSHFVDLDKVNVHYTDQGTGPAILLINGTGGNLHDWDGWVPVLAGEYRVIRVDLPAFGLTGPMPNDNYSVDRMMSLVDSLMDHLGEERFAIFGNSFGGIVAFRYAATRVDRITALGLMNSAGIEWGMKRGSSAKGPTRALAPLDKSPADIRREANMVINDPAKVTDRLVEQRYDFLAAKGRIAQSQRVIALYEYGDPIQKIAHITAPALIQWGGANAGLSSSTADKFEAALVNSAGVTKILYPEGGHVLNIEMPERTARDALAFLRRWVPSPEAGTGHDE